MELIAGKGGTGCVALDDSSVRLLEVNKGAHLERHRVLLPGASSAPPLPVSAGGWLKAPAHRGNFSWLGSLTSLRTLIGTALATHRPLVRRRSARTLDGHSVVAIGDASGGTLYVAGTGNPYPRRAAHQQR